MNKLGAFLRQTFLSGVFLLIPALIFVVLFGKVWRILKPPVTRIMAGLGLEHPAVALVVTTILIIVLCFAAGLVVRFAFVKNIRGWLEENVLRFIPGYQYFRMMFGEQLGSYSENSVAVLVEFDGWQPAILVEEMADGRVVAFIPGVPDTTHGSVHIVPADQVRRLDAPVPAVMRTLRFYGSGIGEIAAGREGSKRP